MNTNKYEGTMFSHCDSILTDKMLEADSLVRKVEYLHEHVDPATLSELSGLFTELDRRLVEKCVTPRFRLVHETSSNPHDQFRSLMFHIKHVFREIYTSWVAGNNSYTPVFSDCMHEIDRRISQEEKFRRVLMRMKK